MPASRRRERIRPLVGDVTAELHRPARRAARTCCFEGAQGTMLDVDHGTFPFVTSSNTVAGYASRRHRPRAARHRRRARHREGVHDARRRRPVPDRTRRRDRPAPVARRPGIRRRHGPPAAHRLVRRRRAAPLDHQQRHHRPVRHQARRARRARRGEAVRGIRRGRRAALRGDAGLAGAGPRGCARSPSCRRRRAPTWRGSSRPAACRSR